MMKLRDLKEARAKLANEKADESQTVLVFTENA